MKLTFLKTVCFQSQSTVIGITESVLIDLIANRPKLKTFLLSNIAIHIFLSPEKLTAIRRGDTPDSCISFTDKKSKQLFPKIYGKI